MQTATLDDVCDLITDGTHYTPPDMGVGISFLTVKDMTPTGLDFLNCSLISEDEFKKAKGQNSTPVSGDVLFSKDGTVGKVHVVDGANDFAVLSSIAILRPNPKLLDSRFVAHYLRSPKALATATQRKTGSALTRIILRDLREIRVPLPPLEEQKRLAAILDQADDLRRKRQHAIDRLNQLGQAIFYEMFCGAHIHPKKEISSFAEVKGGKRLPKGADYELTPSPHPYIRVSDFDGVGIDASGIKYISPQTHAAVRRYVVHSGDVVISIAGTIGLTAAVPPSLSGANLTENAAKITAKTGFEFDPMYLAWALRMPASRSQIAASTGQVTIGKLALFRIEKIAVPIPSIQQQRDFSKAISDIDLALAKQMETRMKLEEMFASLQQRAFAGEL
jgi:type I restriction enzyme S subunit